MELNNRWSQARQAEKSRHVWDVDASTRFSRLMLASPCYEGVVCQGKGLGWSDAGGGGASNCGGRGLLSRQGERRTSSQETREKSQREESRG